MGNKQRLLYFKGHPNNLKAADLVKENRQINQQLSVFTNDVFTVFEFSKRERGKYIVGRAWINKQQHCVQCEIKKT